MYYMSVCKIIETIIRDRLFNLKGGGGGYVFFVSFRIFFSNDTRVRIFLFYCRAKREICFQNSTLGYMTKTLNQIIFFHHQNQNIFFSNIGNQNIFLEKNNNTPLQVKWSFPKWLWTIILLFSFWGNCFPIPHQTTL